MGDCGVQSNTVRLILKRLNAPSAHAWLKYGSLRLLRRGLSWGVGCSAIEIVGDEVGALKYNRGL